MWRSETGRDWAPALSAASTAASSASSLCAAAAIDRLSSTEASSALVTTVISTVPPKIPLAGSTSRSASQFTTMRGSGALSSCSAATTPTPSTTAPRYAAIANWSFRWRGV